MAPPGRPCGRPRKSGSSTTSSTRTSDPLGAFPAPPMIASSFVDSAYGSQPQSQAYNEPHKNDNRTQRVALKPTSPVQARTPIHKNASPTKQGAARMTVGQKQALIDNLRLESTWFFPSLSLGWSCVSSHYNSSIWPHQQQQTRQTAKPCGHMFKFNHRMHKLTSPSH